MVVSSRAIVAVGLGLAGLGVLAGPTLAQQQDGSVRPANTRSASGEAPKPAAPPVFGTIDMSLVFKGYDKVKVRGEEFRAAALAKKNELMKVMQEMQQNSDMLAKLTPNSVDYKKHENRITELKAKIEAEREQAERDFALREAEMLATLYKEVQAMVSRVAKHKGYTYILRISNDPVTSSDPRSAMAAIERTVVYADPGSDITREVVGYLNYEYKAAGGVAPEDPATTAAGTKPTTLK